LAELENQGSLGSSGREVKPGSRFRGISAKPTNLPRFRLIFFVVVILVVVTVLVRIGGVVIVIIEVIVVFVVQLPDGTRRPLVVSLSNHEPARSPFDTLRTSDVRRVCHDAASVGFALSRAGGG
jgi:hypothetical protein